MTDDNNVTPLGVTFKRPPGDDEPMLKLVQTKGGECDHQMAWAKGGDVLGMRMVPIQYLIREGETEIECGNCHAKLDPLWVLRILANREGRYMRTAARYQEEMKRLDQRQRTRCDHCGKMTRISRS